eukprot:COSAG03_NODE_27400_length_253_cov_0.928571_1_plen_84_part_11
MQMEKEMHHRPRGCVHLAMICTSDGLRSVPPYPGYGRSTQPPVPTDAPYLLITRGLPACPASCLCLLPVGGADLVWRLASCLWE